jgi:hypothetical protein
MVRTGMQGLPHMGSALLVIGVVAACLFMLWLARRMEPHWVSKDGTRLICYGQGMTRLGLPIGKWRELRIMKVGGDTLEVKPRRGTLAIPKDTPTLTMGGFFGRGGPKRATYWRVTGRAESDSRRRVIYLLSGCTQEDMPDILAVRMPATSKAIPMFESIAINKQAVSPSPPNQGTRSAEAPPDPD